MGQLEDVLLHRRTVESNIEKSFSDGFSMNDELEKARHGVYADNAQNRKLNRVGQEYGKAAQPKEKAAQRSKKQEDDSGSYQKMASQASDGALKRAVADKDADPKVRDMAKKELEKRGNNSGNSNERKLSNAGVKDISNYIDELTEDCKNYEQAKKELNWFFSDEFDENDDFCKEIAYDYRVSEKTAFSEIKRIAEEKLKKFKDKKEESKTSKKNGGAEGETDEESWRNLGLTDNVVKSVKSAFEDLSKVLDSEDSDLDDEQEASDKFLDKISDLALNDRLTEKGFSKIHESNPDWSYGIDVSWGDVEKRVKEKKELERDRREVIKDVVKNGGNKHLDNFMDDNVKYYQDVLKPYGAKNLFELQNKLEKENKSNKEDPFGYMKYDEIYLQCLIEIPAKEFKNYKK